MKVKRARIYDGLALLAAIIVITLDQWTKSLVVENLSPPESRPPISLIGDYLTIYYIRNSGAAFSFLANNIALVVLIVAAIAVIVYLYVRSINSGSLAYKLIFGIIIGGAFGNLLDRARHSGYVVDFIYFKIPSIGFRFAVFNLADAAISVGVFLLFISIFFGGLQRNSAGEAPDHEHAERNSGALRSTKQDAKS